MPQLTARLRQVRDAVLRFPDTCPQGHGGHQFDARYCRICGRLLPRGDTTPMPNPHPQKPDASWTDDLEDRLRAELEKLGQPTGGNGEQLLKRLLETDKPAGWKWEG